MEIVIIEKKTFEQMKQSFENFSRKARELCGKERGSEKWLGNAEVCKLMQISARTLQTYRDSGILQYTKIGRKCFYRTSDVQQIINQSIN